MREAVDTLIVIPNQHLFKLADRSINFKNAYHKVDDVLRHAVQAITDLINTNGYMNIDFADVRTAMREQGDALMGIGLGSGEKRAIDAAVNAMNNPLLEDCNIAGAHNIIINITSGKEGVSMPEVQEIVDKIAADADEDVVLKYGIVEDDTVGDDIQVTVVATGFQSSIQRIPFAQGNLAQGSAAQAAAEAKNAAKKSDALFSSAEWDNILLSTKPDKGGGQAALFGRGFDKFDKDDIDIPTVLRERKFTLVQNEGMELRRKEA
jgi:cell division protein FtsZ